jgi:thiol:disulfide interchange protein DsbC
MVAVALAAAVPGVLAQEAQIRRALAARLPQFAVIDEVTRTPMPGIYEVRSGTTLFYTDRRGDYVIRGEMLDTRHRTNLTDARMARLSAIDFATLPTQDAIVSTRGQGTRKLAVFADPDCPYCKQLEAMLQERGDITVYTYLTPLLGPGSVEKAKAIWCSADKDAAWRDWMRDGKAPAPASDCDTSALDRNLALHVRHAIRATPTLVFADGTRTSGAPSALQLEGLLAQSRSAPRSRAP